jgi:hypothetical protein
MRWFSRLYGSNPLHLLVTIACFAIAGYAANKLAAGGDVKGILIWLVGAVVGHDLILFPLYALADRSIMMVFRRRPPAMPAVPWINYLRVPVVFSAILLLIWFPLIFRLPTQFQADHTTLSTNVYMGRWLAVTGALFLLSALAFAVRLGMGVGERRGRRSRSAPRHRVADLDSDVTPGPPWQEPFPHGQEPFPPEQRPFPPGLRPFPPEQEPFPPERRPVPPGQGPFPPGQRPVPPGQRPFPPGQRPVPPGQRPYPPGRGPYPPERRPVPPGQRPFPPGQRPFPPGQGQGPYPPGQPRGGSGY